MDFAIDREVFDDGGLVLGACGAGQA